MWSVQPYCRRKSWWSMLTSRRIGVSRALAPLALWLPRPWLQATETLYTLRCSAMLSPANYGRAAGTVIIGRHCRPALTLLWTIWWQKSFDRSKTAWRQGLQNSSEIVVDQNYAGSIMDWIVGVAVCSARRLDLFTWCIRLSRLSVLERT